MDGSGSTDVLPPITFPAGGLVTVSPNRSVVNQSVSLPSESSDSIRAPTGSNCLTNVTYKKGGGNRLRGYGQRTVAYGTHTDDVVKQMYTGTLPPAFFNDVCYGRRATPQREFRYETPTRGREKQLWEPRKLRRAEARHVIRDIQDACFRKQDYLEDRSIKVGRTERHKTEHTLLRYSDIMPRGLQTYLQKYCGLGSDSPTPKQRKRASII